MALVVLVLFLCSVLVVYFYLNTLRYNDFSKKIGGPKGLPFVGVLHRLLSMRDVLYILPKLTGKTKSAFFWLTTLKPTFYTYDPQYIEQILTAQECINKSELYDVIDTEIGSGLISSKSPTWNKMRKILNPCFSHKILQSFFPIFNQESDATLLKFDKLIGCGEIDLTELLQNLSLQTIYATTTGKDLSHTAAENEEFISHVQRYLNTVFERSIVPLMRFGITFQFFEIYKGYLESKKIVHNFVRKVLTKKLAEVEEKGNFISNNSNPIDDTVDIVKSKCKFIDLAIDIHRKNILSWDEVFNEACIMIAAAFETSSTTLSNLLMFIAMHSEYQEKLFEEVVSVFPKKDFNVGFEHLSDLVYMDMFIDETLRIAPSVPLLSRRVTKDAQIADGIWIPHGTIIIIDIFNLHRCKDIWGPNADKFNPDNFLLKNKDGKHSYSYIPFSKGHRNCIGWRYAHMFLKVALSKIVRNYRITTIFPFDHLRCVQHLSLRYEEFPKFEIHSRE